MAQMGCVSSERVPSSVVRVIGDEATTTGVIARSVASETVTVRRCVDVGGPAPMPLLPEPVPAQRRAEPQPSLGRLIPMPCLVAGGAPGPVRSEPVAIPRSEPVEPPRSATFTVAEAPRSAPAAVTESTPVSTLEPLPPSSIDVMAQTEPEIPFVTAQLVVSAPARRARPEPELPGVIVRPSLVLTAEQLAHDDTSSLLMLTPPSVTEFCLPPRANDPSAPTMPRLSTRTVPLSVFSARTMPVPVLEPSAEPRKTSTRLVAALGLCVVLVFAFVAGLLVTTAVVVSIDPTSCR